MWVTLPESKAEAKALVTIRKTLVTIGKILVTKGKTLATEGKTNHGLAKSR